MVLSERLGCEVHAYATHRVVEYHHWMKAGEGRMMRCFAYSGESGEVLCNDGPLTTAERSLKFAKAPVREWTPDEGDVMAVAAGWSFDPSTLSARSAEAALGVLVQLK